MKKLILPTEYSVSQYIGYEMEKKCILDKAVNINHNTAQSIYIWSKPHIRDRLFIMDHFLNNFLKLNFNV